MKKNSPEDVKVSLKSILNELKCLKEHISELKELNFELLHQSLVENTTNLSDSALNKLEEGLNFLILAETNIESSVSPLKEVHKVFNKRKK